MECIDIDDLRLAILSQMSHFFEQQTNGISLEFKRIANLIKKKQFENLLIIVLCLHSLIECNYSEVLTIQLVQ